MERVYAISAEFFRDSSSSSEDESDDEAVILMHEASLLLLRLDRNRVPLYVESVVPRYLATEFRRLFRLTRETARNLTDRFEASPYYPRGEHGRPQITAEKTMLIGLTYLATQMTVNHIADKFDVAESSVEVCLNRLLEFLFIISAEIIRWSTPAERERSGYLLGDSAYPLQPWLLTPYKCPSKNCEEGFKSVHSQQRVIVEGAFGLLKNRFRRLLYVNSRSLKQIVLIIIGSCVLHNMCTESNDDDENDELPSQGLDVSNVREDGDISSCPSKFRDDIAQTL
ncbi:hypothetical protein V5799_022886 [Amblyomma americanum]|uniref:DDE Tnp4 domain-containing protein n=1 Tax=Amblyomma americanum TaxID=6943 RepID=A0AAQ4FJT9_AMBAM